MSSVSSVAVSVVDVLVDRDFDWVWLGYRHGNVLLNRHGVGFLYGVRHWFLNWNCYRLVDWDSDRMRYGNVDWIRLWNRDWDWMRDVDWDRMGNRNSNMFDYWHSDGFLNFNVLSDRHRCLALPASTVPSAIAVTSSITSAIASPIASAVAAT